MLGVCHHVESLEGMAVWRSLESPFASADELILLVDGGYVVEDAG